MPKLLSPGPQWEYIKEPSSSRTSSPYTSDNLQIMAGSDAHGDQTQPGIKKRKGHEDTEELIVKKPRSDMGKHRASINGRSSKTDSQSVEKENPDLPRPVPSQSRATQYTARNQSGMHPSSPTAAVASEDRTHKKASPVQVKREPRQQVLSRTGAQKSRTVSLENYFDVVGTSKDRNSVHVKRPSQDSQGVGGPSRNVVSSNSIEIIEISSDDDEVPTQGVRAGSSLMGPPSSIIPKPPPRTSPQKTLSRPTPKPALSDLLPSSSQSRPNAPPPSEVIELSSESDGAPQSPPRTSPSPSPPPPRQPRLDFARKRTTRKRPNSNLMAMPRRRGIRSSEDVDEQEGLSPSSVDDTMDVEERAQPAATQGRGSLKKPFHLTRDLDLNGSDHESNDGMQTEDFLPSTQSLHAAEDRPDHRRRPKTSETTPKARGPSTSTKSNGKSIEIDMTGLQDALETIPGSSKGTGGKVAPLNKASTTASSSSARGVQPARKPLQTLQSLADAITEAGQKNVVVGHVASKVNLGATTSISSAGSRSSLSEIRARRNLGVKLGYSEQGKQDSAPSPVNGVAAEDGHANKRDTSMSKSNTVSDRNKGKGKAGNDPQLAVKSMSSAPASLRASPLHSEMEVAPDPDIQPDVEMRNSYASEPHSAGDSEVDAQHTSGRSSVDREEGMSLPENRERPRRPRRTKTAPKGTYIEPPLDDFNVTSLPESGRSSPSLAADNTPPPIGREFGGYKSITWETERQRLLVVPPKYFRALDLPHALQDQMNWMIEKNPYNLQGTRHVFEASIFENTMDDEPDAPPIMIVNDVDSEVTPPWEFYYSNKMWHGEAVPPPDINGLAHCDCVGKCDPKSKTCKCLQRQREFGNGGDFAYDSRGKLKVPDYPIFECNLLCRCGDDCRNRVVQHGRQVALNVRKTPKKGWGVFAVKKILKGSFIGIYAGELLTDAEGEKRGKTYDNIGRTYLFDLDFHHLREGTNWSTKYVVDAFHVGNFTRFLNHSCDPNSSLYPCYVNETNIDKPLLAIFSTRDIEVDEEICFSYTGDADPDDEDADNDQEYMPSPPPGSDAAMTATVSGENTTTTMTVTKKKSSYEQCSCGARNCKGNFF